MAGVVTGEAVLLELSVANFPSRIAALLIDMLAQVAVFLLGLVGIVVAFGHLNPDYLAAIVLSLLVVVVVVYPTTFETLSRGKTLGKMALGIRVVGDDGSPVRFRQALIRSLFGIFEIWTLALAPVGLVVSIVSVKGKRVGDMFAGTYVIQERVPTRRALPPVFAVVPPPLAGWSQGLQVSRLSDQTAAVAGSYLRRFTELNQQARDALGIQLANAVAAQVSPPPPAGTPPAAYLSAVLAVRRQQELSRLTAAAPAGLIAAGPDSVTLRQPGADQAPAGLALAGQAPADPAPAGQAPAGQAPVLPGDAPPAQPSGGPQEFAPPA